MARRDAILLGLAARVSRQASPPSTTSRSRASIGQGFCKGHQKDKIAQGSGTPVQEEGRGVLVLFHIFHPTLVILRFNSVSYLPNQVPTVHCHQKNAEGRGHASLPELPRGVPSSTPTWLPLQSPLLALACAFCCQHSPLSPFLTPLILVTWGSLLIRHLLQDDFHPHEPLSYPSFEFP